jgi:aryl-alcohol dehydrogenase-like predicted oxidoreductase
MEYRSLGRTGLMVSELCLGCMTFGRETDEEGSREIVARFLDAGGTSWTPPTSTQLVYLRR